MKQSLNYYLLSLYLELDEFNRETQQQSFLGFESCAVHEIQKQKGSLDNNKNETV